MRRRSVEITLGLASFRGSIYSDWARAAENQPFALRWMLTPGDEAVMKRHTLA
jgi:hypothetical protein